MKIVDAVVVVVVAAAAAGVAVVVSCDERAGGIDWGVGGGFGADCGDYGDWKEEDEYGFDWHGGEGDAVVWKCGLGCWLRLEVEANYSLAIDCLVADELAVDSNCAATVGCVTPVAAGAESGIPTGGDDVVAVAAARDSLGCSSAAG